jgi:itaconate CoA-transferase
VRKTRPRLICCSISGYGPGGPYGSKKAYDLLVQCETGLVMSTGTAEVPSKAGISIADIATGMYAYSGILTALYDRERTGLGTSLHVAMLDALGEWMSQPVYFCRYGQEPVRRTGVRHPSIPPYGPYRTCDGTIFLGVQNDREWATLCGEILQRPELAEDARFRSNTDRVDNNTELTAILEEAFGDLGADRISGMLDRAGIASARLRTPEEFTRHPQLRARDRWRRVLTPGGDIDALLPPVEVAGQEPVMGPLPALGEHTEAVRAELGISSPNGLPA